MGVTLRFPYQLHAITGPPPLSLPAGTTHRWRPIVPVAIVSSSTGRRQFIRRALADTGSDDTIFPHYMAGALGIPFLGDPKVPVSILWRGKSFAFRFGEVDLELDDGVSACRWKTIVAFSTAPLSFALLGQIGVLQFFDTTFRAVDRVTLFEPVASFPGTVTTQP